MTEETSETKITNLDVIVEKFKLYMQNSSQIFLDYSDQAYQSCVSKEQTQKIIEAFLTDSKLPHLYFLVENQSEDIKIKTKLVDFNPGNAVLFVKKNELKLEQQNLEKILRSSFHLINIGQINKDFNPAGVARNCIKNALGPMIKDIQSFSNESEKQKNCILNKQSQDEDFLKNVQKKLDDIEMIFLRNNVSNEVPTVKLIFDDEIKDLIQKNPQATPDNLPPQLSNEQAFFQRLTETLNGWGQRAHILLGYDVIFDSLDGEKQFWENYLKSVQDLERQLASPEAHLTVEILKIKKKFIKKYDIAEELNLKVKIESIESIHEIFKEIDTRLITQAKTIDELSVNIIQIFGSIKKIFQNHNYPATKCFKVLENFSKQITQKLIEIFDQEKIMEIPYERFGEIQNEFKNKIINIWTNQIDIIKNMTQNTSFLQSHSTHKTMHSLLQTRIKELFDFRGQNENMKKIIQEIYNKEGFMQNKLSANFVKEEDIDKTYQKFLERTNLFDLSKSGKNSLQESIQIYNQEIDAFEKEIIMKIRDMLGSTKNYNEMFNVFTQFSTLMQRSSIKNAIREYQDQLLKKIQDKSNNYMNKYRSNFKNTGSVKIAQYYGMLDISGKYIWGEQISAHVDQSIGDIEKILGDNLKNTETGKEIKKYYETFQKMRQKDLENKELEKNEVEISGALLKLENVHRTNSLKLAVNFTPENEKMIVELRNIIKKKDYFKSSLSKKYYFKKNAWPVYVNALRLMETVRMWNFIVPKIDNNMVKLLANQLQNVYTQIEKGLQFEWNNRDHENDFSKYFFVFYEAVQDLEVATTYLFEKMVQIENCVKELSTCDNTFKKFNDQLLIIQEIVDELLLKKFTNIDFLVNETNDKIEKVFQKRLQEILNTWTEEFTKYYQSKKLRNKNKLIKDYKKHEIKVKNNKIFIEPPIQESRSYWLGELHQKIHVFTQQNQIQVNRYRMAIIEDSKPKKKDFSQILEKTSVNLLANAYKSINSTINNAEKYVKTWLSYQALWEIDVEFFSEKIGSDMKTWQIVLNDIKIGRSTFDQITFEKNFGPIIINYKNVQAKINNLYDILHKNILNEFANKFINNSQKALQEVKQQQEILEEINFNDPAKLVQNISAINYCETNMPRWEEEFSRSRDNEKILTQQKYHFAEEYKNADQIEKDFKKFKQIFQNRQKNFKNNLDQIKTVLGSEEEILMGKIDEIKKLWNEKKPFGADLQADEALGVLDTLESTILTNKNKLEELNKAKALLKLPEIELDLIYLIIEDSTVLRKMWNKVKEIWAPCDEMMKTSFDVLNPVQFTKTMDKILTQISDLPPEFKNHEIFQGKKKEIADIKKSFRLIKDMKSEAIKEHHLKELLHVIHLEKNPGDIVLGDFFKLNILAYEKQINDIVAHAAGELVLETMLTKIKDFWMEKQFELSNYQGKVELIKGWDEVMEKAEEDLGQLNSMKLSQHFKTFEGEINQWNDKILKISNCLSVWMDVQRKWVYLEGIFLGSSDIKEQLRSEYDRFQKVDHEFKNIMKQMSQKIRIAETVGGIPNLLKTLEFLSETLDKIQKSLSDYLEMQRQAFSRFYFVGDEDLLEIIGNSKQIASIQKYFSKMFAGINSIKNESEGKILTGMLSKETEEVSFNQKFNMDEYPKINLWLTKVEEQMQQSLAKELENSIDSWKQVQTNELRQLVEKYPTQVVILAFQTFWTWNIEEHLMNNLSPSAIEKKIISFLSFMAEEVLKPLPKLTRVRYQQLITEMVHKRDVSREMTLPGIQIKSFKWQYYMRYNLNVKETKIQDRLKVNMGNSWFFYSYEYLGITDKLVQTPLTDKCYFTLTQALWLRMGGAPFGPAGTGKTESVKMLGNCLGRFVLVFNCDETFNFKAMGRIFIGLCQVGAWGCFDEFNRLEERILSAVSQQILAIQTGLREDKERIDLMNKSVLINPNMGIFVTMNPGYAGRSNLPENLKQLFRQMAMIKPDSVLIAQVMLFSQGFKSAEELSGKVVALFELCSDQLSSQPHYDFGLRALKSVLNSAGNLKRKILNENLVEDPHSLPEEQKIILRSFCDTVVPKLISDDGPLLKSLIQGVFPQSKIPPIEDKELLDKLPEECERRFLLFENEKFKEKVLQLSQILKLHHGVMLVGPTGCGKSAAWRTLLSTQTLVDGKKGEKYVIDPKALTKDELYGKLDNTTMEWTDGIFTYVLRKICENQRGESSKNHWIVFDGDVDPEWAENLNSVLDDNKLLTLPNGERLSIPPNVKILFEVESLKYATLATVSRCGMVWFSEDIVGNEHIYEHYLLRLCEDNFDSLTKIKTQEISESSKLRQQCVSYIRPMFFSEGKCLVTTALDLAETENHVMIFSRIRVLEAFFALVRKGISKVVEKNENTFDNFAKNSEVVKKFILNWTIFALNWAFVGDLKLGERSEYFSKLQAGLSRLPEGLTWPDINSQITLIDYEVRLDDGEFSPWKSKVPVLDIQPEQVTNANLIITTVDTLRHQEVLCGWLLEHRPFIICGPPGSGKTMTLMSTLNSLQDFEMIFVNFSSSTNPQLILKQFEHYCEYVKGANQIILRPRTPNKWLVVFCDEINLPDEDKYGTQYVITFLRQLTEQHGFWRAHDKQWVKLERIQFVGACNPPTDAGRHPLAQRFLRHTPLILVDFPGYDSLVQIYGTFNRGMLKRNPNLKPYADSLTKAMVDYYTDSQKRFTSDQQPHYIYSPRELTRWKYALNEALDTVENLDDLVRLWAHEALRLFEDRLVNDEEKKWCQAKVDELAQSIFPGISTQCLERPIIFSTYLTKAYQSVKREDLRVYVLDKLKVFNEEEYDVQLVVFDEVLEHIIKIDRVLKQPIGHMLLVGASGVGKTTLSRFVSWINGLKVFQIKAGRNYSLANFDEDLRHVMKKAGCKMEKITFIFDESNVISVAFLERMNALLASGEIPGLFEGEEYISLINTYKEAQGGSKVTETDEEIYANFTKQVQRNLHVVFTMNPANPDFSNRTASSPAIFNRCVIDWFGDWPETALYQVAKELTQDLDYKEIEHSVIVELIVKIHKSVILLNKKLRAGTMQFNYMTPRDYIDFIRQYLSLMKEKQNLLNDTHKHLNEGLNSLKQTEDSVNELKKDLKKFNEELEIKNTAANEKLELIIQKKKESKEKIESSLNLQKQITVKKAEISTKTEEVNKELSEAGPALEKAKESVSKISSAQLTEIRNYKTPPKKIQLCLEAVFYIIKGSQMQWDVIKKEMGKAGFIDNVLEFDINDVPEKIKNDVEKKYLENPEWNIEQIYKGSKAAGPLAEWLESQIKYKKILLMVTPLRDLIKSLDKENKDLEDKQKELETTIKELEANIVAYSKEYEELIAQTEDLKNQKENVSKKINKAESLLMGLNSEKIRWTQSSKDFSIQFKTLTGDVLLSAAFLTYIGFFGQYYRVLLLDVWKSYIDKAKIPFKKDLSLIEFLSLPSERILWQRKSLPSDTLCMQNAIILKRFNRYPLIIDPSGQAYDFMVNLYKDEEKELIRTSFIDEGFMKQLETSLRFGRPIMIQDVEKIEPILNSVLNKEIVKQGGRVLIRVGDQEIDFSKEFKLFMITRNANANFTPDLCSRVTFVNFTVTKSSLENQFTFMYLKNERADVEEKRINFLKLQGEFIVKLRQLEDDLLHEISKSQGTNILENDEMILKLETIKKESTNIEEQMSKSDVVLQEINEVINQYKILASISSKLYFLLQKTSLINMMYQYSLKFYMRIIEKLLTENETLKAIPGDNYERRIKVIGDELFNRVYEKIDTSVLEKDKLLFALRFTQVKIFDLYGNNVDELFKLTFQPPKLIETSLSSSLLGGLEPSVLIKIEDLSKKPGFEGVLDSMRTDEKKWKEIIQNSKCLNLTFYDFISYENLGIDFQSHPERKEIVNRIIELIFFNILKPSKTLILFKNFVDFILGKEFLDTNYFNLERTVKEDADNKSPILFSSAPGFDPSSKIYELAKKMNKIYDDVAIGSAEGFELAYKSIEKAIKNGSWVILKNVHLAPTWLKQLEQDLYRMNPNQNFRLFLLAEFSDKIPVTLIRQSVVFIFELPDGVKASVKRTYNTVYSSQRSDKHPPERCRLHFLLGWIHAVIMERLRYTPTGWSKKYEFSEADQKCALDIIDQYVDKQEARQNLQIENIPFEALRSIITNNIYGGKIDNAFDLKILKSIIDQYFTSEAFDPNNVLIEDKGVVVKHPDAVKHEDFKSWIQNLKELETPVWAGLPSSADDLLIIEKLEHILVSLGKVQETDTESISDLDEKQKEDTDVKGSFLQDVAERTKIFLEILPGQMDKLERNEELISNPLFRFIEREITLSGNLLSTVRKALQNVLDMAQGTSLPLQDTKKLAEEIILNVIPKFWRKYTVPNNLGFSQWIKDFKNRIQQLTPLPKLKDWQRKGINLGEFLFPEAFITATRQFVAQNKQVSMDELELRISMTKDKNVDEDSFLVNNLWIEGVKWGENGLQLSDEMLHHLQGVKFTWQKCRLQDAKVLKDNEIFVPLYLNQSRQNLVLAVKFEIDITKVSDKMLYQRGIALIAWKLQQIYYMY